MSRFRSNLAFVALSKLDDCTPRLISRVRHNQIPLSASQRTELDQLVAQGQRELAMYTEYLPDSQEEAFYLGTEKGRLEEQVSFAKSLMAPIRRLPPEILDEIFIAHGTPNIIKSKSCDIPGLKIASVCSHWRSIAFANTRLWRHTLIICRENHPPWHGGRSLLIENLLGLSGNSFLTVSIDARGKITEAPPVLLLLCQQAHRWQRLHGICSPEASAIQTVLSSLKGHLNALESFHFLDPSQVSLTCIENAPQLHKLALFTMNTENIVVPWNQLLHFTVAQSSLCLLVQAIAKMPQLTKLSAALCMNSDHDNIAYMRPVRSNLAALEIGIINLFTEQNMSLLFDALTLPNLNFLSIITEHNHITNQQEQRWSANQLPSFISRSSVLLTTFELRKTWIPTNDLISLLRQMPKLILLSIVEPFQGESDTTKPMINDEFLLHIRCEANRQTVLPDLTSLILEDCKLSSFSMDAFIKLIHSRFDYSFIDVAPIRKVRLQISCGTVPLSGEIRSLLALRTKGLVVEIQDQDGDIAREI